MMEFRLYDDEGRLAYMGRNWEYARRYLDYLVRTLPDPPSLEIYNVPSPEVSPCRIS